MTILKEYKLQIYSINFKELKLDKETTNDNQLISVIIPAYNRARIIEKSITSILTQSYSNIELLIIDDCSTDNTKEVVERIQDSRIRYICLDHNSGACVARNRGITEAKGDYIAFNDSDDQWRPEKLQKQIDFLLQNKADIILCAMECKDDDSNFLHIFPNNVMEGKIFYDSLLKYNCASTQTLFGKASCFKEITFDSTMPRLQDWDEVLRLSQNYTVFFQNEILVDTFIQKDSISTHPEKGVVAMNKLFQKHSTTILSKKEIAESFFKKQAAFSCRANQNPIDEMRILSKNFPTLKNKLSYTLAKTGLYKVLFNIKNN